MPPAGKKAFSVPEEYQDRSANWQRAFQHAKSHGNPDKVAILYAESSSDNHAEGKEAESGSHTPADVE